MAIADIVQDVRWLLQDQPPEDTMDTAPTGTTGVSMNTGSTTLWENGDIAEFSNDGEQALLLAVSSDSVTNMVRGYNGTTAGTHTTSHRIKKNPLYGQVQIEEAIGKAADMMWPEVYEVAEATVTPSGTAFVYTTPAAYAGFISLIQAASGTITDYRRVTVDEVPVPVAFATSGVGLRIIDWHRADVAGTLIYKTKVTSATTDTALQHLLALGAARHLLVGRGTEEADDEPEDQDTSQRVLRGSSFIESEYQKALASYRSTLKHKYVGRRRFIR